MAEFKITTKSGKPLSRDKYTLDLDNRVFGTKEHNLVLDFTDNNSWSFKTGSDCVFKTYAYNCTFITGARCRFKTSAGCTFRTGYYCTFNTGSGCVFRTSAVCEFKTGDNCTFQTAHDCTFKTGSNCTFNIWDIYSCEFKSYDDNSIILDRKDKKRYIINKEFITLQKVRNG